MYNKVELHLETLFTIVNRDNRVRTRVLRILVKKSFVCKPVVTPQCNFVSYLILQSTGGSAGEDEEELSGTCLETKHNTHHNEFLDHELLEVSSCDLSSYPLLPSTWSKIERYVTEIIYVCRTTPVSGTDSKNVYTKAKQKV